jgi:hypothetical protein
MIDALQKSGVNWSLNSNQQPLLIKMLMLASASETNAAREAPQAWAVEPGRRDRGHQQASARRYWCEAGPEWRTSWPLTMNTTISAMFVA